MDRPNYFREKIPNSRIATFDVGVLSRRRHTVSTFLEFDVTDLREEIKKNKEKGINISFTASLLKILVHVLKKHPHIAAYRRGRELHLFDELIISTLVETMIDNRPVPLPALIRDISSRSVQQISDDLRCVKKGGNSEFISVKNDGTSLSGKLYPRLPSILRRIIWHVMLRRPKFLHRVMGNVVVTSLGMMGRINGWFLHTTVHPLSIGIGSVLEKPVVNNGELCVREILNLTLLFDHDAVDGAPIVRFVNDLQNAVESPAEFLMPE